MNAETLAIETLDIRHDIQARTELNSAVVAEYAAAMREGDELPPVVAFHDGKTYLLADGFHRVAAAKAAGRETITADVRKGTRRDAAMFSCSANATHGLRRSLADRRRAVELCIQALKEAGEEWSDRQVAKHCGVGHQLVADVMADMGLRQSRPSRVDDHPLSSLSDEEQAALEHHEAILAATLPTVRGVFAAEKAIRDMGQESKYARLFGH